MNENEPNRIVFTAEAYDGEERKMWGDIAYTLNLMTKNGYVCVFRKDEVGIYVIDFVYDDEAMGTPYPYFMTPDEHDEWECHKSQDPDDGTEKELPFG